MTSYDSALDLLRAVELVGVHIVEAHAEAASRTEDEKDVSFEVAHGTRQGGFYVMFKMDISEPTASIRVIVRTTFAFEETAETKADIPELVLKEFIEKVAVMAAYPFLRQGVATMATVVEAPVPLLGLLRSGEFRLDQLPPPDVSQPV